MLKSLQSKCKQRSSTSLGKEIPVHPWTKLVTDIFNFEGASYVLTVDYTSRFLIVCKLSSVTDVHIANKYKLIFSEYGWPETLITDNDPCYISQTFTSVMKSYNVNHITSIILIVKSLFYKAKEEGKDLYRCLMIYCTTPYMWYAITYADSLRQEC